MSRKRLTREDWVDAAVEVMRLHGPEAVGVEQVAASLGSTKGSGYWHFSSRAELLEGALERWRRVGTDELLEAVEAGGGSAEDRLGRLVTQITSHALAHPGDLMVISSGDPLVRQVVASATERRLEHIASLLREAGVATAEAEARALVTYAAYLGHATLAVTSPRVIPTSAAARRRLHAAMIGVALPPAP
jgi:AcrR family transcriptional regulator